ncbi:hypothetical protein L7F22_037237 [Adiantum nelumboides]|nr:hypothetical protein [Adiantum nelumboides]
MLPIFLQLLLFVIPALLSVNVNGAKTKASTWIPKQHPYPKVPRGTKTWSYRSAKLGRNDTFADPYYELEKPLDTDPGVIKFIDEQTQLLGDYVKGCKSKDKIAKSIAETFDYNDYDYVQLITQAPKPFYLYNVKSGKDNRPIWYTCTPSEMDAARNKNLATPPGKKFLDETLLSVNATVNIQYTFISNDGQYFAYIASDSNSDVAKIYVRKFSSPLVQAKTFPPGGEGALPDAIPFVDGNSGFVWTKDSTGFFYVQVNDDQGGSNADAGYTVRYHKLGTAYEKDITVVHPDKVGPDEKQNYWFIYASLDSKWFLLTGLNDVSGKAKVYASIYGDQVISDHMKWISIAPGYEYVLQWMDVVDNYLYFWTNLNAVDGRVAKCKLDWSKARSVTDLSQLTDKLPMIGLIPEIPYSKITFQYVFNHDKVLITYTTNGRYISKIYNFITGKLLQNVLPNEPSMIYNAIADSEGVVAHFAGTFSPKTIYRISFEGGKYTETLLTQQAIKGTNPNDYITEEHYATSKDGTKVPYAIQYHKGVKKDGTAIGWQHWYAANGYIETFFWNPSYFSWIRSHNTVFVWCSGRGGGDRGEHWHKAGQNHNRQNAYDDIIAIAQDLVAKKIVAKGLLIGEGASAGGMAAAVVANQAPPGQTDEYGNVYDPVDYDYTRAWSPLQNINDKQHYPAMMFQPADSDDRVVAAHSFKCLAQLQYSNPNNPAPLMMYLARSAGHSSYGLSTDAYTDETIYQHCFAELALGIKRTD